MTQCVIPTYLHDLSNGWQIVPQHALRTFSFGVCFHGLIFFCSSSEYWKLRFCFWSIPLLINVKQTVRFVGYPNSLIFELLWLASGISSASLQSGLCDLCVCRFVCMPVLSHNSLNAIWSLIISVWGIPETANDVWDPSFDFFIFFIFFIEPVFPQQPHLVWVKTPSKWMVVDSCYSPVMLLLSWVLTVGNVCRSVCSTGRNTFGSKRRYWSLNLCMHAIHASFRSRCKMRLSCPNYMFHQSLWQLCILAII